MQEIRERILAVLDKAGKDATQALNNAQAEVDKANGAFDRAVGTLREKQREVGRANSKFDAAIRDLTRKQNDVRNLCRLRSCYSSKLFFHQYVYNETD